jgi:hypothetical protein
VRKVTITELKQLALNSRDAIRQAADSRGHEPKLYLHWAASDYDQRFADYHINIDGSGELYASTDDLSAVLAHTYMRNVGGIGIAWDCCKDATPDDMGDYPPTALQIEAMAQAVAILAKALEISIDLQHVLTHAEAGNNLDGFDPGYEANGCPHGIYGPSPNPDGSSGGDCERWDLWFLKTGDPIWSGGNTVRGKALWYQQNIFPTALHTDTVIG